MQPITTGALFVLLACAACEREPPRASAPDEPAPEEPTSIATAPSPSPPSPTATDAETPPPPIEDPPAEHPSATPSATTTSAAAAGAQCTRDSDCACGTHRTTGKCAFGPASEINVKKQCPDFCSGIAGHLRIACKDGRCVQVSR